MRKNHPNVQAQRRLPREIGVPVHAPIHVYVPTPIITTDLAFTGTGDHDPHFLEFKTKIPKFNVKVDRLPPHKLDIHDFSKIQKQPTSYVNLSNKITTVYDQGQLGSCTANALCELFMCEYSNTILPSRLFLYYNERVIENDVPTDAGANLSDGISSLLSQGVCLESLWPYVISKFAVKPPSNCYSQSIKISKAQHVSQDINSMKNCLLSGKPFCFGFLVFPQFQSYQAYKTGIITMPQRGQQSIGGHAVICIGYDDSKQVWICRNSWGSGWGINGNFYMPYAYLLNPSLTSDLWIIWK